MHTSKKSTIDMNKIIVIFAACSVLACGFAGCFASDDESEEDTGFSWPDQLETGCQVSNESGVSCDIYAEFEGTPVLTMDDPEGNAIWFVNLDGFVTKWVQESTNQLVSQHSVVGDLSGIVSRCHFEQGLLGMEFDEDYNSTNRVLLIYNENKTCESAKDSNIVLSHVKIVDGKMDMSTLEVLITVNKNNRNHNGGSIISVGNNQYIWSIGDGGGSFDPYGNGQNASNMLGTIQMIHYENESIIGSENNSDSSYTLHYGLRNPWRIDVDPNGNLWIADVGQLCYEEVNMVSLMQSSNFGWSVREGFHDLDPEGGCYENQSAHDTRYTDPIAEYDHSNGHCSIIGGYWMDWGPEIFRDSYIYGDFCTGQIWKISQDNGTWVVTDVVNTGTMIVGFGKGIEGELLIFSWAGAIYQLSDSYSESDLP